MNAVKWASAYLAFTASLFSQAPTNDLIGRYPMDGDGRDLSPDANTLVTIYQCSTKIGENDNWASTLSTTFSSVGAFGLTAGIKDAAITVSLPAGGYTVQVSGAEGGVGEALVEIYELP
jgi:hypothetical protein